MNNGVVTQMNPTWNSIVARILQGFLREAGDLLSPEVRQKFFDHIDKVSKSAKFDEIPRDVLALILVELTTSSSYQDSLAVYGVLARSSPKLALLMESEVVWKTLVAAYLKRSKPGENAVTYVDDISDEEREMTARNHELFMQTLFDHYGPAVNSRAAQSIQNPERWRTWKRILEHFKRHDDNIGDVRTEAFTYQKDLNIEDNMGLYMLLNLFSAINSPFVVGMRQNNQLFYLSGFIDATDWLSLETMRERTYSDLKFGKLVAFPSSGGSPPYLLLIWTPHPNPVSRRAPKIYIDYIDIIGTHPRYNKDKSVSFILPNIGEYPAYIERLDATSEFLWISSRAWTPNQPAKPTNTQFVYRFDLKTQKYSLFQTLNLEGEVPTILMAHEFRSNVFATIAFRRMAVYKLGKTGVISKVESEIRRSPQFYETVSPRGGLCYFHEYYGEELVTSLYAVDIDKALARKSLSVHETTIETGVLTQNPKNSRNVILITNRWIFNLFSYANTTTNRRQITEGLIYDVDKIQWDIPKRFALVNTETRPIFFERNLGSSIIGSKFHDGNLYFFTRETVFVYIFSRDQFSRTGMYYLSSSSSSSTHPSQTEASPFEGKRMSWWH